MDSRSRSVGAGQMSNLLHGILHQANEHHDQLNATQSFSSKQIGEIIRRKLAIPMDVYDLARRTQAASSGGKHQHAPIISLK